MIAIVMAGGKGSRMNSVEEKLLLKYKKPIVLHVIEALKRSKCFSKILAITSSNSPQTKKLLEENNIETFNTFGNGYVEDLNFVLKSLSGSVFIISADLPLMDSNTIQKIIQHCDLNNEWTTILVTKEFRDLLHLSPSFEINFANKSCYYTGISVVNTKNISTIENLSEEFIIIDDKRIAFNINTKNDYGLLSTA